MAVELDRENERDEEQRHAAEPGQLRHPRRVLRNFLQHHDQAQERRDGKCRRQQAHDVVRIHRGHEPVDEEKLRQASHGGGGPRNNPVAKLFQEQEWEQRKHCEENQIPRQRQIRRDVGIHGIEPVGVPGAFQRRDAGQTDGGQPVLRKHFRHTQQQHDQEQGQPEDRRRICQRQPQRGHNEQQERQHRRERRQERGQAFRLQGILVERDGFGEQIGFQFAHGPDADGDEENRKRAKQEKRDGQPGKFHGDFENQRAGGSEGEHHHDQNRQ